MLAAQQEAEEEEEEEETAAPVTENLNTKMKKKVTFWTTEAQPM